jgi:UDP-N-acetylglucosamine 3-dehydrogenase
MMIQIGLIGAGFMGTTHANAYKQIPAARIKWVVDRDLPRAETIAGDSDASPTDDMDKVFTDPEINVVDITLPTPFHAEIAIKALKAGKHVIVEKPIALTIQEALSMVDAARESDRWLMVGHVLRFIPEYSALIQQVTNGQYGRPLLAHAYRLSNIPQWADWFKDPQKTGGAVIDLQIHDIDILNLLFGKPASVYSLGSKDLNGGWNSLYSLIKYPQGAASIECSFNKPRDYPFTCGLRVECEKGEVEYYMRAGGASFEQGEPSSFLLVHEDGKPNRKIDFTVGEGFVNELGYFIGCVDKGKKPERLTVEDAILALKTAKAAEVSLESGEIVRLSEYKGGVNG